MSDIVTSEREDSYRANPPPIFDPTEHISWVMKSLSSGCTMDAKFCPRMTPILPPRYVRMLGLA